MTQNLSPHFGEHYAGFGEQSLLMEYKSPSLGIQLTDALSDENLADITVWHA